MGKFMTSIWISVGFGVASLIQLRFDKPTQNKFKFKNASPNIDDQPEIDSRRSISFGELDKQVDEMMKL